MGLFAMSAVGSTDQVEFPLEHDPTKGKEIIMMECTLGATPKLLLGRPIGLLALHGRDGEDDDAKPSEDAEDESKDGAKPDGDKEKGEAKPKVETETVETLTRKLANSEEARNRAADKRDEYKAENTDLKAQIAKMEKDGTPDDAIKTRNDELEKANATLTSTNQQLMLEIALRDDKAHDWVNPAAVLKLADLTEVEYDEKTKKVHNLKAALDKLAKEQPYLLKPKADPAGDDADDKGKQRGTGKAPAPRNKATDSAAAAERAKLLAKYPALRR